VVAFGFGFAGQLPSLRQDAREKAIVEASVTLAERRSTLLLRALCPILCPPSIENRSKW
jgi:hypothetical protein